jgi:Eco29kI restriction endonuclease
MQDKLPDGDPHYFDFDLDRGIREQVVEKLENSPAYSLSKTVGPNESGVYALYHKGALAYIGKASKDTTTSKRTLRSRLAEHASKIKKLEDLQNRVKLIDIEYRYLTFASEWWVFAAEFALITHYDPPWNGSGFGSKTPGVGRPGTNRVSKWQKFLMGDKPVVPGSEDDTTQ